MGRPNKQSAFLDEASPIFRDLNKCSKSALIDIAVDAMKRMFGEDVFEDHPEECAAYLCGPVLRCRGDRNPWRRVKVDECGVPGEHYEDE